LEGFEGAFLTLIGKERTATRQLISRVNAGLRELRFLLILCAISVGTMILVAFLALSKIWKANVPIAITTAEPEP
jgi:hypothetical protein